MSDSKVLASPPGECCTKTVQHSGTAVGVFEDLNGVNTYVSYPPTRQERYRRVIFFFADVFGPMYINNQLIMDYFASKGYLVLGPDYFEGDFVFHHYGVEPDFDLGKWVGPKREKAYQLVPTFVDAAKAKFGTTETKYAAVGYCFGGPDVLGLTATDWLAAGAIAHPAMLDEDHFVNSKRPLFLSCAETDHTFPTDARHRSEELLRDSAFKPEYHFQVFARVAHGFAIRGNPDVPHERWAKEQSANGIIGWFDRFCN